MNQNELKIDENSVLLTTDPLLVGICLLVSILLSWFCAYKFRNNNDFMKSVKLYLILGIIVAIVFVVLGLPILFSLGGILCGFVTMMWFSNYYFYHK